MAVVKGLITEHITGMSRHICKTFSQLGSDKEQREKINELKRTHPGPGYVVILTTCT